MPSVSEGSPSGARTAVLQDIAARVIAANRLRALEASIGKLPIRCRIDWLSREMGDAAATDSEVQPEPSQEER